MKKTYWEKLKDPRWQRLRLTIMERDGFVCQSCMDEQSTLNVHHRIYRKGADPWDYAESELVTLCETCHKNEHAIADSLKEILCIASEKKIPAGWIAAMILGFVESHMRVDEDFSPGEIDRFYSLAEDFPSAYITGRMSMKQMTEIALKMGPLANG